MSRRRSPIHVPTRLHGRDHELEQVSTLLGRVASGRRELALLDGIPGIGKSALLAHVLGQAAGAGFQVLRGQGHELTQEVPFASLSGALAHVPGQPLVVDLGRGYLQVLDSILAQVERLAQQGPVLIAMDDLHWADEPSLQALCHVASGVEAMPVALLGTLRPGLSRPPLGRLVQAFAAMGGRLLGLDPLAEEAVAAIAAEALGHRPDAALLGYLGLAGGNPLYVSELLRGLQQEGGPARVDAGGQGAIDLASKRLPASFRRLVLGRLGALPEVTLETLRLASVLGSSFDPSELIDLTGISAAELARALTPALAGGWLADGGDDRIVFRHPLVREAIYEEIPPSLLRTLHRQAAHSLAWQGASPVRVAAHMSLGARPGDEEAISWLTMAAREHLAQAPPVSLTLLERAIEVAGDGHPDRHRLQADRCVALVWNGRAAEAAEAAASLLDQVRGGRQEVGVRKTLVGASMLLGRGRECVEEAEALAACPLATESETAVAWGDAAMGRLLTGDPEAARGSAEQSLAQAARLADPMALSVALSASALVVYFQGRVAEAIELACRSEEELLRAESPEAAVRANRAWVGMCLAEGERFEEAAAQLARARSDSSQAGLVWHGAFCHLVAGRAHWIAGEWDDCLAEMGIARSIAEQHGIGWISPHSWAYVALTAFHRDEDAEVRAALEAAGAGFAATGAASGLEITTWVQALALEADGQVEAAAAVLSALSEMVVNAGYAIQGLLLGPDAVRVALAAGQGEAAAAACERVEEVARRSGLDSARGIALRCRGLLEGRADLLVQAVAHLRAGRRRAELAFACEDAGRALAAHGDLEAGMPLLEEALAAYGRLRARRPMARVAAALRALGVRRRPVDLTPRPRYGWAALTETERRVVGLASEGLTNPEIANRLFISRNTVHTHLAHVFAKLGISSRVELAVIHSRESA